MELKPKTERLDARLAGDIARAAAILRSGGIVAFPTETVYGLGADALSNEAVAKIFKAKMRPGWDPLIVHVCDREMLKRVVGGALTKVAELLAQKFWPGPLTLLLPRGAEVPDAVTAGRALVGVRMPAHPVALELIRLAGVPIAAPSANLFGHTSPTTAEHVLADLDGRIDAVLDGGPTEVGIESTVAELTGSGAIVYRPGGVTLAMLDGVLGDGAAHLYEPEWTAQPESLPSPGVGLRHYAPKAKLVLSQIRQSAPEAGEAFRSWVRVLLKDTGSLGVMLPDGWPTEPEALAFAWGPWDRLDILAQRLYAGLHELDRRGVSTIVCPLPGALGLGLAIQDRLYKAAK